MQITIEYLEQQVGKALSRIELNPRFCLEIRKQNNESDSTYTLYYYPESGAGKLFIDFFQKNRSIMGYTCPSLLITSITKSVDAFLAKKVEDIVFPVKFPIK